MIFVIIQIDQFITYIFPELRSDSSLIWITTTTPTHTDSLELINSNFFSSQTLRSNLFYSWWNFFFQSDKLLRILLDISIFNEWSFLYSRILNRSIDTIFFSNIYKTNDKRFSVLHQPTECIKIWISTVRLCVNRPICVPI